MTAIDSWRDELLARAPSSWPAFLDEHSGLPGHRANIELGVAFASLADAAQATELAASADEYRAFCGAVALGRRASDAAAVERLRVVASDARWRVREGLATGLQLLGDEDLAALEALVLAWADDADPLVQRAAAAAICEPRLLEAPATAAVALEVCRRATAHLSALPRERRRDDAVRTLRQGLGYCWSVAIAADPEPGLAVFRALDASDPDVAWIVAENHRKKRLARLL